MWYLWDHHLYFIMSCFCCCHVGVWLKAGLFYQAEIIKSDLDKVVQNEGGGMEPRREQSDMRYKVVFCVINEKAHKPHLSRMIHVCICVYMYVCVCVCVCVCACVCICIHTYFFHILVAIIIWTIFRCPSLYLLCLFLSNRIESSIPCSIHTLNKTDWLWSESVRLRLFSGLILRTLLG